jgi:Raf kinase inhibitor-like YbhB/YbcL family protein
MERYFCYVIIMGTIIFVILGTQMAKNDSKFELSSTAFAHNERIPSKYTCDGENISPDLSWKNVPEGTKSFALIVDDPDAPAKVWVHWIVFNISSAITHLEENATTNNFMTGLNDFKTQNYGGPCPPSGTHRYQFTLYALDTTLQLQKSVDKQTLINAMQNHILDTATLIGIYQRKK